MAHKPGHGGGKPDKGGGGGGGKPDKGGGGGGGKPPKGGGGGPLAPAVGGGVALKKVRPPSRRLGLKARFAGSRRRRGAGTLLGGSGGVFAPSGFGLKTLLGI